MAGGSNGNGNGRNGWWTPSFIFQLFAWALSIVISGVVTAYTMRDAMTRELRLEMNATIDLKIKGLVTESQLISALRQLESQNKDVSIAIARIEEQLRGSGRVR